MITHPTVLDIDAQARRYTDLNHSPAMATEESTTRRRTRLARGVSLLSRRLRGGRSGATAESPGATAQRDLTAREAEVLQLIATGRSTREIAAALEISEGTVERHITNLYAKIRVRSRSEATVYAFAHGLAAVPVP